jgi:UDP-N-acetylglucosamine diphosphorylase/glucosamine-1-phosphate N-acetyltransferase
LYRHQFPGVRVNDFAWLGAAPVLLVNGRWLPPARFTPAVDRSCVGIVGDEAAYVALTAPAAGPGSWEALDECLEGWKSQLPQVAAPGKVFRHLWEVVQHNGEQIRRDFEAGLIPQPARGLWLDTGPALVGSPEWLAVDPSARIDPMVVIDTTRGPVIIERHAVVHAFSRLEGPCHLGAGTEVHGAKVRGGTTLGPQCRIGGEVEASIVQGYSNKYHDGFLGHAYVGAWVNLGAGTQNSDLRNDYGEVTVTVGGRAVRTGLTKVGCFLGDHTKTALGTLLNTGTSVGAFCNLLPAGLSPRAIPSFTTWWNGDVVERTTRW